MLFVCTASTRNQRHFVHMIVLFDFFSSFYKYRFFLLPLFLFSLRVRWLCTHRRNTVTPSLLHPPCSAQSQDNVANAAIWCGEKLQRVCCRVHTQLYTMRCAFVGGYFDNTTSPGVLFSSLFASICALRICCMCMHTRYEHGTSRSQSAERMRNPLEYWSSHNLFTPKHMAAVQRSAKYFAPYAKCLCTSVTNGNDGFFFVVRTRSQGRRVNIEKSLM